MHRYTDSRVTSIDRDASSSRAPVSSGTTPRSYTSVSQTFRDLRGTIITRQPTFHAPRRLLLIEPRTFTDLAQRIGSLARDWSEAMRRFTPTPLTLTRCARLASRPPSLSRTGVEVAFPYTRQPRGDR
jgi:hypothetical protein